MTFIHLRFGIILVLAPAITMVRYKRPFKEGVICNMEYFQSVTHRVVNKFFCTPISTCRPGPHRIPVIPFDVCNDYYYGTNLEDLVCCHRSDFKETPGSTWMTSYIFAPSVKSYIMCRHYSHLLCGEGGESYCLNPGVLKVTSNTQGLSENIEQFPHSALIGYAINDQNKTFRWFCMGSIVSDRAILTSGNCEAEEINGVRHPATHVKVGETNICEHCWDRPGEQIIPIYRWELDLTQNSDISFILLTHLIEFNHKVRPACFLRQPYEPTKGVYAHYGKPDNYVTTAKSIWPVFHFPRNNTFITFKVKTSQNAVIHLSRTGVPNQRERYWQINIGQIVNGRMRSSIELGELPLVYGDTPNIVHEDEFRGFWITIEKDGTLSFGEEDKPIPTLALEDIYCCFNVSVIGLSTPDSTGEWVFADQDELFSLNGKETDVLWGDKCAEVQPNFETVEKYKNRTNEFFYVGEAEFCAGGTTKGVTPCDNDWGSTIQVFNTSKMPCMWQMFGMYSQKEKRNCSTVNTPGVFVNFANHLAYMEDTAYPTFTYDWFDLNVEIPLCQRLPSNLTDPGRCPPYIPPK